jgi:glycosyltransferase involved in cell wall biosynthesis
MRCLMVVDSYNWALHNRAVNLRDRIKDINFDILYFKDCKDNFDNYDVVYLLNWPIYGYVKDKIKKNRKHRLITSVSSHIGRKNAKYMTQMFNLFDAISCSNMFLFKEFKHSGINSDIFYTPFGVNTDVFFNKREFREPKLFGWVGNLKRNVKRFPIIEKACKKNGVKLVCATSTTGYSRSEMNDFYNKISCLICFSESEGTPNPVLESLSCGTNVISSYVGNVPEIINEFGLIKRVSTYEEMSNQIKNYKFKDADNSGFRMEWSWNNKSKAFVRFIRGF